jgi:DNA-binding NarL/FixJ family response regulator
VRVLVVDGAPAVRARVVERLREAGHDVVGEAGSLSDTVHLAGTLRPDAIVLDLQLPDGSALDVIPSLTTATWRPAVVVLTHASGAAYRRVCHRMGVLRFLDKARDFDVVADALREAPR